LESVDFALTGSECLLVQPFVSLPTAELIHLFTFLAEYVCATCLWTRTSVLSTPQGVVAECPSVSTYIDFCCCTTGVCDSDVMISIGFIINLQEVVVFPTSGVLIDIGVREVLDEGIEIHPE
jgi:hypothetical protein